MGEIGSLVRPDALGEVVWINGKGLEGGEKVCTKTDYMYTKVLSCGPKNDLMKTGIHHSF